MNEAFKRVLGRYNIRLAKERQLLAADPSRMRKNPNEFLLGIGEAAGHLLHTLIVGRGARRILELGTSYGYSTLFFADAARETGGTVITVDKFGDKQEHARRELTEAGLDGFVEFHTGDLLDILPGLEGPFDFVLIDVWKQHYVPCLDLVRPKLAEHAIIAADNIIRPRISRAHAEKYRAAVRADGRFQSVLLPIGQGIELSCFWPDRSKRELDET